MSKKKILILGANPETAVLVKKAKDMGIYTIVTDYLPNSYAKKFADKAYNIDGLDVEHLVEMAKEEQVDGVLVGTADPLIPTYHSVCKRLGLPSYTTDEAVEAFTNKRMFKKVCGRFGINGVPEYTLEQVRKSEVTFPVLIKPADGRSGKGMSVCYSLDEIDEAIEKAMSQSRCKEIIIERYMECDDVFMYYTFSEGETFLSAMPDRFTSNEQRGVDPVVLGAVYPSKYIDVYMEKLHEKMCNMFKSLKIRNGILLIQAFVENEEFYVYDPGFRLQGGAPHILIEKINGIDQQEMLIKHAITGKTDLERIRQKNDYFFNNKVGASQVILLKAGVIGKINGLDIVREKKEVIAVTQRLFEGDSVTMIGTEQQILVRFHLVCENKEQLRSVVDFINNTIRVYDTKGNDMMLNGLNVQWF